MKTVLAALLLILVTAWAVQAFELTISPTTAHVQPRQRVKVMCQADVPLVGCQFKRVFSNNVYNLTLGAQTPYNREFSYYGTGLETGQCGVSLTEYVREHIYDVIACRVRAKDGGWQYAQMSLVINSNATYKLSITPSRPVVLPGGEVTILCQADQAINSCLFKWNNASWTGLNASMTNVGVAGFRYSGSGLDRGQCGITFANATPVLTGNVFCSAWTKSKPKGYEAATVPLVVAAAPNAPVLNVANASVPANDTLLASCVVRQAIPAPRIIWLLGDDVIGEDACLDAAGADWRWPYEATDCEATLARRVDWLDDGKELTCRVQHVALPGGRVDVKQVVNVIFAPLGPTVPIEMHGFQPDRAAEIEVHVVANPKPTFAWSFANASLAEGDALEGGRVQALRATKGECGWRAKLVISSLAQSDLEQDVRLIATSEMGSTEVQLLLDTAPASTDDVEAAQCAGRVKHVAESKLAVPDVVAPAQKREEHVAEAASCPHTGLTIAILLLVLLVAGVGVWYARSKRGWCVGRKQFARSSLGDDAEDTDEVDARRIRMSL